MTKRHHKAESTPEEWAAYLQYMREWRLSRIDKARETARRNSAKPEMVAWRKAYHARPEVKARKRELQRTSEYIERRREYQARARTKAHRRLAQQKRRTGMSIETINQLMAAQNGSCAICHRPFGPQIRVCADHCHDTNIPRGLLCLFCNTVEGMLKKLPVGPVEFAERLTRYLAQPPASRIGQTILASVEVN